MLGLFDALMCELPRASEPRAAELELLGTYPSPDAVRCSCDMLRFAAFGCASERQIWIRMSGGMSGEVLWYGPLSDTDPRAVRLLGELGRMVR